MGDMTMEQPFSRPLRLPQDIEPLAWPHIDRVGQITGALRQRLAIDSRNFKGTAVDAGRPFPLPL